MAFNKHIANELQQRLPATVPAMTLHAMGFAAVRKAMSGVAMEEGKLTRLAKEIAPKAYPSQRRQAEQLARLCKYTLAPEASPAILDAMADHYGVEVEERDREKVFDLAGKLVERSAADVGSIDYDDMVWLPSRLALAVDGFDLLLVDEAQDLNKAQQSLALKATRGGRLCPIGDRNQCHPGDTMVTMTGGEVVPISTLKVGDSLVSFNPQQGRLAGLRTQGRRVEAVASREYEGDLYDVNGTPCTPNHKWLTRLSANCRDLIALYLMELEDGSFRIGQTQLMGMTGFGPGVRARQEGAVSLWVLVLFANREEARESEFKDHLRFRIPQRAQYETSSDNWPRELIAEGVAPDVGGILARYRKRREHPLWTKQSGAHIGKYSFVTQACNLFQGANLIARGNGDGDKVTWEPLRISTSEGWRGRVYSLSVQPTEGGHRLYLANGNVTSNSIYGFTGADTDGLPNLSKQLPDCVTLPLTVTWRCPASHVALAQAIVPTLDAAPDAVEGEVAVADLEEIVTSVRPGDLVICRKNAPVLSMTYRLALAGVPAVMRGRDVGKGLLSLIARLKPDGVKDLVLKVEDYREREEAKLRRRDASASQFDSLSDRCDCLSMLAAQAASLEDLERFIRDTFSDAEKPGGAVVLSSVHRAKGLEAERVFVLDPDSLPMIRRDSKAWQLAQEKNLAYIAATRSKRLLTFEGRVPSIFRGRR